MSITRMLVAAVSGTISAEDVTVNELRAVLGRLRRIQGRNHETRIAGMMGLRTISALLVAGVVLCAADVPPPPAVAPPVAASGETTPASVSPESLAAAHELLTAMNAQNNALTMFKSLRGVLIQNIQNRNNKPTDEVAGIVDQVLMPEIESRMNEFIDMLAGIQASVYTVDEMHQLMAFYDSPIGKRTIELTPKIGSMSFAAGQEWGKRVALDALQKNAEELRRRGVKL